jgi:cytidylate kinase
MSHPLFTVVASITVPLIAGINRNATAKLAAKTLGPSGSSKGSRAFAATNPHLNGLDYLVSGVGECRLFRLVRQKWVRKTRLVHAFRTMWEGDRRSMAIVTISHAAFTGGSAIAEQVAAALNYRSVNREVLIEASQRYGIPEAKFEEVLETQGHWWERWLESLRLYRITLQAAMCEVAQPGNLVYHGRAGQELFPGIRHVLKVLIVASMDYRIEQVKAQRGLADESARQFLKDLDRVRGRRLRALFNIDWQDPTGYDLILNTSRITAEMAACLIAEAARRPEYRPTPQSEKAFQDLTIAARVQAALITSPKTRNVILNVTSDDGRVNISGILADPDLEKEIVRVTKEVPGVKDVTTDIEPPPIEYMHP